MDHIKIGKNVIENLTTGMYQDSLIVFREYIQNAVDQIDYARRMGMFEGKDLKVEISICQDSRSIEIKDNATGIQQNDVFERLAHVADSIKDRDVDKGFRGIGRLGGIGYCDKLMFITSSYNEDIETTLIFDAKLCRELLYDKNFTFSAEELLKRIITMETKKCAKLDHYFKVKLVDVRRENNDLLDVAKVKAYISDTAPVDYSSNFYFRDKIYDYIKDKSLRIDRYKIELNAEDVFKNYVTFLYEKNNGAKKKYDEIYDIQFKQFKNDKDQLLAWMWFGVCGFIRAIPEAANPMRGLRLRKGNIQIGDSSTLMKFFKEARGNSYFVGEVHVTHKGIIPNARRDYFNENENRNELEAKLKDYFSSNLHKMYHDANKVKNLHKKEVNFFRAKKDLNEKEKVGFVSAEEKEELERKLKVAETDIKKVDKELEKFKDKAEKDPTFKRIVKALEDKHKADLEQLEGYGEISEKKDVKDDVNENDNKKKTMYIVDDLSRLNKKEKKLVSRIYKIIQDHLDPDTSKELIKKINTGLNK